MLVAAAVEVVEFDGFVEFAVGVVVVVAVVVVAEDENVGAHSLELDRAEVLEHLHAPISVSKFKIFYQFQNICSLKN